MKIKLDIKKIREIIEAANGAEEAIVGIYSHIIPDWENVVSMEQYPKAHESMNLKVAEIFQETSRKKGWGSVGAAFMWCNYGFSVCHGENIPPGEVWLDESLIRRAA